MIKKKSLSIAIVAVFCSMTALQTMASNVKVDINLDMKHSVRGVSDFGRDRHITIHANIDEQDWKNIDDAKYYIMNELDVTFGRDNGHASWLMGFTPQNENVPGAPDVSKLAGISEWSTRGYFNRGDAVLSYETRDQSLIMGINPELAYPNYTYWGGLHGQEGEENGGKYHLTDWDASSDWIAEYLDKFFRSERNPYGQPLPQYWEVVNEPDMKLNKVGWATYYGSWEKLFKYHIDVADKVRNKLGNRAPLIGGMTWGLHDLHQGDTWGRANGSGTLGKVTQHDDSSRRQMIAIPHRDPDYLSEKNSWDPVVQYKKVCADIGATYPCVESEELKAGDRKKFDEIWAATESSIWDYDTTLPYSQWDHIWKGFMDSAGEKMDFYAIHLYDWNFHDSDGNSFDLEKEKAHSTIRSGGHVEGVFDLVEWYQQHKFGESKPWVVSEYGNIVTGEHPGMDYRYADWAHVRTYNWMFMQMLTRPDQISVSMPFNPLKASWGYTWGVVGHDENGGEIHGPIMRYEPSLLQNDDLKLAHEPGGWYITDKIHWYELWSEVDGTRIDTASTDPDVQVDAYVDGNTVFLILNNIEWQSSNVDLSFIGANGNTPNKVSLKHNYMGAGLSDYAPGHSILADAELKALPRSLELPAGSTMVLRVDYANPVLLTEESRENKFYAESLSGAGTEDGVIHRVAANDGGASAMINDVIIPTNGEAVLRITGSFHNQDFAADQPWTSISVNGNVLDLPTRTYTDPKWGEKSHFDFLGTDITKGQNNLFRTVQFPVPLEYLQEDNKVEWKINRGGTYAAVALSVWDMSRDVVRTDEGPCSPCASVQGLSITQQSVVVGVKQSAYLEPVFTPSDADDQRIDWSSDNIKVAFVDPNGIVTGLSLGSATITGISKDGGHRVEKTVEVVAVEPENVEIMYGDSSLWVGESRLFSAYVSPWGASNKNVVWTSMSPDIAKVDANGNITGVASGKAIIQAVTSVGQRADSITVEVSKLDLIDIAVNTNRTLLPIGDTLPISVSFTPSNASYQGLTWSSDNNAVATVDRNGVISGIATGSTTISVVANDGDHRENIVVNVVSSTELPAEIELEDFIATGGAGAGFKPYVISADAGGINDNIAGDWGDYDVTFEKSGAYQMKLMASSPTSPAGVDVFLNGEKVASAGISNNGEWDAFEENHITNTLIIPSKGTYRIRVQSTGNPGTWVWNGDKFLLTHIAPCGVVVCGATSSSNVMTSSSSSASISSQANSNPSNSQSSESSPMQGQSSVQSSSSDPSSVEINIIAEKLPIGNGVINRGESDVTVLKFKLSSNVGGSRVSSFSIKAGGAGLHDANDVIEVRIVDHEDNVVGTGVYSRDNGVIKFDMVSPIFISAQGSVFSVIYDLK